MFATDKKAAPVNLGVRAPSGDRSDPFTQEQEKTIMPQTTDTNQQGRFQGDRYERLAQGADLVASTRGIYNDNDVINGDFIRAFARDIARAELLDGMSERDCDTFAMLITLDTRMGVSRIAWRIQQWLEGDCIGRDTDDDDPLAVCSALTAALKMLIDTFIGVLGRLDDEAQRG
ncbi:MAG: hypothetical protein VX424_22455 [Actinomycetota bacterium]|nr:hypothetical protein [Actinomycetota bacterium]